MNLCYLDMGLAAPSATGRYAVSETANISGKDEAIAKWFARELQLFGGDPRTAAEFCLRLAAVRLGILTGPSEPSFEQLRDPALWHKAAPG